MSDRYGQTGEKRSEAVLLNESDKKSRRQRGIRIRARKTTLIPVFREFNTIDNFSLSVPMFTAAKQALQTNSTIISWHDS